ncbi:hypothetical protein G5B47_06640 [Paenibacillus sp. 7124]|uniref:Uncharacterized protein n=2 Tax=Paenibacillus TaxID=44249 RepID=A0A6M1PIF1_9BACL|nr:MULTISPECIES: hypothetical protein [Paenibacillus]AHV99572.1 hypothetical protein PSAB_23425 [Paenibacillus sabinae T27]NGM82085.1 hypothetical protein [Paenibacillus apii]NJJ39220.1 hypothetical protein [Paenibacillus apii]
MRHYESSMRSNSTVDQAEDAAAKLHNAVSQAMSHPTEQVIEQAENSLKHAEQAVRHAPEGSVQGHGVDLAEEMLATEKERLASLSKQNR